MTLSVATSITSWSPAVQQSSRLGLVRGSGLDGKPGWEIPMNRQYLEYIPEIGTPAANSHHGQQQPLRQQPGCKAANPSDHHDAKACSPWTDHVGDSERYSSSLAEV
mgnify:CR=1 FL=1